MKIKHQEILTYLSIWVMLSFAASMIKVGVDDCDKTYPVDYVFYTGLFCEIKE